MLMVIAFLWVPISELLINRPPDKNPSLPTKQICPDWTNIMSNIIQISDGIEASTVDCFKLSTSQSESGPTSG